MKPQKFWVDNPVLPTDSVVDLLVEQGNLLPESTDGLLKAGLHIVNVNPDSEKIIYCIEPVNAFMHSIMFHLFEFERPLGVQFPFTLTVFPLMKQHLYKVEILDQSVFVREFKKAVNADLTKYMIQHKQSILDGNKPGPDDTFLYPAPEPVEPEPVEPEPADPDPIVEPIPIDM